MGKIKGKMVKRSSEHLIKAGVPFTSEFDKNKKILRNEMPSKKIRNQMAGYTARLMKNKEKERAKMKGISMSE